MTSPVFLTRLSPYVPVWLDARPLNCHRGEALSPVKVYLYAGWVALSLIIRKGAKIPFCDGFVPVSEHLQVDAGRRHLSFRDDFNRGVAANRRLTA